MTGPKAPAARKIVRKSSKDVPSAAGELSATRPRRGRLTQVACGPCQKRKARVSLLSVQLCTNRDLTHPSAMDCGLNVVLARAESERAPTKLDQVRAELLC
jgi:hypothetical protein